MIKRLLLVLLGLGFGVITSNAQLYVSPKACLVDPSTPVNPPTTGPNTGSGTTAPPQSCNELPHFFESSTNPNGTWTWDFGDGAVLASASRNPAHAYTAVRTYRVSVTANNEDGVPIAGPFFSEIKVGYYPQQPLFRGKAAADTTICKGKTITLDPFEQLLGSGPANVDYKWFPGGETTREIEVSEAGCYSVEVIDRTTGCSRSAKINVKLCYEDPASGGGSEKWLFGHGSGMEFSLTGTEMLQDSLADEGSLDPRPELTDPAFQHEANPPINNAFLAEEAAAVVFDQFNNLVLYSDGIKLFSGKDHSEIPLTGGNPFENKNMGAQGLAIVPKPVCNACDFLQYYVFTADENTGILSYSVIDMRENNKRGAVITANVPVAVGIAGKITVERSQDDESFFITAYNASSGGFYSVVVDSLGTLVAEQTLDPLAPGTTSNGYVAISPDGNTLAHGLVIDGNNHIQLVSRNNETNQLASPQTIDLGIPAPPTVYGLAFSPNGEFLYVTLKGDGSTIPSQLLQIPVNDPSTITVIGTSMHEFGALGLGPKYGTGDKYIYLSIKNLSSIHYIQEPNEAGRDAASFTLNQSGNTGLQVAGEPKLGFPNVVAAKAEEEGQGLGANYSGNCLNGPTFLTAQQICDPMKNEFEWEVEGQTYKEESPVHYFSRPGWHTIKLTVKVYRQTALGNAAGNTTGGLTGNLGNEHCTTEVFEGKIYIKPAPEVSIPDPLYLCPEYPYNGLTFEPQPTGGTTFSYEWLTHLDAPVHADYQAPILTLQATTGNGLFKVKVTNELNCTLTQPFRVEEGCEPIVEAPTVFTPNGDRSNDTFEIVNHFIVRPKLEIYNRWGEQVFQTDNLEVTWDGRYKGQLLGNQLFAYVLRYYARDFPQAGEQRKTGSILLIADEN